MDPNQYLNNPVVAKGFYNVRCCNVEVIDGGLPTIIVKLRVVPYEPYGEAQEQVLHVTLRATPNAQPMHDLFRQTFRVGRCPTEAIGRFGCVLVDTTEFKGRRYSAVHFIRQSDPAKNQARALERADRDGEIEWTAGPHFGHALEQRL